VRDTTQPATTINLTLADFTNASTISSVSSTFVYTSNTYQVPNTTPTSEEGTEIITDISVLTTAETLSLSSAVTETNIPSTQSSVTNFSLENSTSTITTNAPEISSPSTVYVTDETIEESTMTVSNQISFTTVPAVIDTTTLVESTQIDLCKSL